MGSKHTPGPWKWSSPYRFTETLCGCGTLEGPNGEHVLIGCEDSIDACSFGESDAILIEAAPDLLAACKAVVSATKKPVYDGSRALALEQVQAAIARAEGR